jgi:hypothetical protein
VSCVRLVLVAAIIPYPGRRFSCGTIHVSIDRINNVEDGSNAMPRPQRTSVAAVVQRIPVTRVGGILPANLHPNGRQRLGGPPCPCIQMPCSENAEVAPTDASKELTPNRFGHIDRRKVPANG